MQSSIFRSSHTCPLPRSNQSQCKHSNPDNNKNQSMSSNYDHIKLLQPDHLKHDRKSTREKIALGVLLLSPTRGPCSPSPPKTLCTPQYSLSQPGPEWVVWSNQEIRHRTSFFFQQKGIVMMAKMGQHIRSYLLVCWSAAPVGLTRKADLLQHVPEMKRRRVQRFIGMEAAMHTCQARLWKEQDCVTICHLTSSSQPCASPAARSRRNPYQSAPTPRTAPFSEAPGSKWA